jgi:hypothetical protein
MSNTVTKVRELVGWPFAGNTDNVLWQTDEGTYITTSFAPANEYEPAETIAFHADGKLGLPVDWSDVANEKLTVIEDTEPQHEKALNEFGFTVAED